MLRLLLVSLLALGLSDLALAQDRWHVRCEHGGYYHGSEMCDDTQPVSVATAVRHQLDHTTAWLDGLGFLPPYVMVENGRFVAWIGPDTLRSDGQEVNGYYDKYREGGGYLTTDAFHYFQIEGDRDDTGTPAHEMFHAVQGSYPIYDQRSEAADWHRWLFEGTAQAVEAAWLHRDEGVPLWGPGGHVYVYGHRDYSHPLHRPYLTGNARQAFATNHFWLAVGETIGAADRVGYLHDLLATVGPEHEGLSGVDAALREHNPEGLYDLFPEVISRYATDREHFTARQQARLSTPSDIEHPISIEPVAANYYKLTVHDIPERGADVEISLAENPDLHLIVNGQRYDILDGEERNVFKTHVVDETVFYVHVVNVSAEAAESEQQSGILKAKVDPVEDPVGCFDDEEFGGTFRVTGSGPALSGNHIITIPFTAHTGQARGRTVTWYPGLTRFLREGGVGVLWADDGESDEYDLEANSNALQSSWQPLGLSANIATTDGSGMIGGINGSQIRFSDGRGANAAIMTSGWQPGTHEATIGVGVADGRPGVQLGAATVTFTTLDPGTCIIGTFQGAYEQPVGQVHSVNGSFRINVPSDAVEVDMRR